MDIYQQTLNDFARQIGLTSLNPGTAGTVELTVAEVGIINIELAGESVLITLARPYLRHASRTAQTALQQCHWRQANPWPVSPGIKGEEYLTLTAAPALNTFDLPLLEHILQQLIKMFNTIETTG